MFTEIQIVAAKKAININNFDIQYLGKKLEYFVKIIALKDKILAESNYSNCLLLEQRIQYITMGYHKNNPLYKHILEKLLEMYAITSKKLLEIQK